MRWRDLSSAELVEELRRWRRSLPSVAGGGCDLAVTLSLEQLEPLAAALQCEECGREVCPGCHQEVISGCEYGLGTCPPCGLLLLAPIDFLEPRPA